MQPTRWNIGLIGVALILVAGAADWFTGPQISSTVFYLIPICLVTWKGGRLLGTTAALVSGITWLFVDLNSDPSYAHTLVPYWNGLVRLIIFLLIALLISEVAERERAEADLRKIRDELERQRGILQSILDSMKEGVIVADAKGGLLLLNPAAEQMLGLRSGESRPDTWLDLQKKRQHDWRLETQPAGAHPLARAMRGEVVEGAEFLINDPDSPDGLWLLANGRPWLNAAGNVNGGMIVLTDMTARRNLERQIAEASEREQQKLGQDLHDGLCQRLASMSFAARMLADKLEERHLPEANEAGKLANLLAESISQAKNVAKGLYLVQLEAGGLSSALEELAVNVNSDYGLQCTFIDRTVVPMTNGFATVDLFRIAQEAVTNAVKHARPKQVTITLESDEEHITLSVEDDGCGMPKNLDKAQGMGLRIMNYRARIIGAQCAIEAVPNGGTVVTCRLQHRNHKTALAHVK